LSSLKSWNTTPIERRSSGICAAGIAVMLRPATRIWPCVGTSSRKTSFRNVVLPAPDGTGQEAELALLDVQRDVEERRRLSVVRFVDVERLDHAAAAL
jgi:hypothetical protein